jgi:hypothetical protein
VGGRAGAIVALILVGSWLMLRSTTQAMDTRFVVVAIDADP